MLRQDPDIIMVGEMRDQETAMIAIEAALTGHLVFSTLHTNDAPGAVARLMDMGVEPFLIASATIGVMAQRLLRKVCEKCKQPYEPPRDAIKRLGMNLDEIERSKVTFYRGRGCDTCKGTRLQRPCRLLRTDAGHRQGPRTDPGARFGICHPRGRDRGRNAVAQRRRYGEDPARHDDARRVAARYLRWLGAYRYGDVHEGVVAVYLTDIHIKDFRCIRETRFQLNYPGRLDDRASSSPGRVSNVNLFIGGNGAGKSSVFRAMPLAILEPVISNSGFNAEFSVRRSTNGTPSGNNAGRSYRRCDPRRIRSYKKAKHLCFGIDSSISRY